MTRFRDRTVLHLQIARTLRSITQGIAVVDLTLYLKDLHWSGTAIGGVLSAAGLVGGVLILLIGILSDRLGRKPFLLTYEMMTALAALLMTLTSNPVILSVIIVLTGFGRGQNGAAEPFTPAEQAWMAARVPRSQRGSVFSTNTALGFFGMALGAVLAGLPKVWSNSLPGALGFHPLFVIMSLLSFACVLIIGTAPTGVTRESRQQSTTSKHSQTEGNIPSSESVAAPVPSDERSIRRQENLNMAKLAGVNALNGLAIGFMGPMMSYWFSAKFGVSSSQLV